MIAGNARDSLPFAVPAQYGGDMTAHIFEHGLVRASSFMSTRIKLSMQLSEQMETIPFRPPFLARSAALMNGRDYL